MLLCKCKIKFQNITWDGDFQDPKHFAETIEKQLAIANTRRHKQKCLCALLCNKFY